MSTTIPEFARVAEEERRARAEEERHARAEKIASRAYKAHDPGYPLPSVVLQIAKTAALITLEESETTR